MPQDAFKYLFDLALILISTKVFGLFTRRIHLPQVVGALLAGLIFGPAGLGILQETEFLTHLSEIGVIVMMFSAGMETDVKDLKNSGKAGFVVALIGVIIPLAGGTLLGMFFTPEGASSTSMIENVFIGTILTATSVSITVETLTELGKLNCKVGNTILAAALIDDVLGLIVLTIVTSLGGGDENIGFVLLKILLFFIFVGLVALLGRKFFTWYENRTSRNLRRYPILAFVLCLGMAYLAEEVFGVSDIIGAFAAGMIIGSTPKSEYVASKFSPLSYLLLTPIFFANIGIKVVLPDMTTSLIIFTVLLIVIAIATKLIGCGLGAKLVKFTNKESFQVGIGMVCRGEVALIVANKGVAMGIMPPLFFGPIIIMIVACTIFTPIALKLAFRDKDKPAVALKSADGQVIQECEPESPIAKRLEKKRMLDELTHQELDKFYIAEKESGEKDKKS